MKEFLGDQSLKEILNKNDRVLIDFYADWCGPCKMIKPILEEVEKSAPNVLFLSVNVDRYNDLASTFEITSIPHLVMFVGGEEVARKIGFLAHNEIIDLINS